MARQRETKFTSYPVQSDEGFIGALVRTIADSTYTLLNSDSGKVIDFTAGCTITIPSGLDANFCAGLSQGGASQITVAAGAGVTLNEPDGQFKSEKQYVVLTLSAFSANNFRLFGRTGA